ncbi:ATP-binding protein [Streptomyces sp. LZ34]
MHFHHTRASEDHVRVVPRQLPGDARGFVNRRAELHRLDAILTGGEGDSVVVAICVIAGTAGAGKTSLALRWAHQVKTDFPDGQLYVNLRGYDPGEPITAQEALHRFLTGLGVAAGAVPTDTESAAALFRSLLADRKVLIVLDNAATVTQVRPLLPGHPGSLVVVTSRGRLSGLAVRDGAHRITLGTLPEPEAVALLRAVTSGYRPEDDTEKLAELAHLCARLPLALRIAAERAASHPYMHLDELIADLRDESALWAALSTGDEQDADAVRTVFAWSYRALPPDAARLFRLLGVHPGPGFGVAAVSALAGVSVRQGRQLLDVLVGAHLLEQTAPDRFEFHDLLRAYATDESRLEETADSRAAALRRVLDWYLHTADAAQSWIAPAREHVPLGPADESAVPLSFSDFETGRLTEAESNLGEALAVHQRMVNKRSVGNVLRMRSAIHLERGELPEADRVAHEALDISLELRDHALEGYWLLYVGDAQRALGQYAEALTSYQRSAVLHRRLGDRSREALAWHGAGGAYQRLGRHGEAADFYRRAAMVH